MVYPDHIVNMYKDLNGAEQALEVALGRNYYDKETVVNKLQEEVDGIAYAIQEEARIYAAETGADRDGSYVEDRVLEDLEEQLRG